MDIEATPPALPKAIAPVDERHKLPVVLPFADEAEERAWVEIEATLSRR